ncbi:hypothetical protein HQ393_05025 [Chitinibacter bivalviorum]|uniref:Rap1a immunity protein domain-containing protein n=1 Tax=Chitinibacter bivalviorum TaxID=2739434 RepID=A0A7H9BGE1_9NEIS|nr:hypothetical protein [Chitinibacter bivalviorum]QLG87667.1 hypothetical protein HQ393_05025 [Chitinibacter bivalviorum]
MMNFGRKLFLITALVHQLTIPTIANAEDKNGNFVVGGGVGGVECPEFVSTMERATSHGLGSSEYTQAIYPYVMFIAGFMTGYNAQAKDTCNIFDSYSNDQRLAWLNNYCKSNPLDKFGSAVIKLSKEVYPKRKKSCS